LRKVETAVALASYLLMLSSGSFINNKTYNADASIHKAVATSYKNELKLPIHNEIKVNKNNITLAPKIPINLEKQIEQQLKQIETEEKKQKEIQYQKDLYLLANLVDKEAGSNWLCDEHQKLVVCVVLNRIKSNSFPDTIHDVIYQKNPVIQYQSAWSSSLNDKPSDRAIKNVKAVLNGEYTCPNDIVYQSERRQGRVYKQFYNKYTGTTTYFCYSK
jgi:spore germination cell wall hydrolase CwlJ-like protein